MTVQLNTDNNVSIGNDYAEKLDQLIRDEFSRYDEYLTRIELHFSDVNADRNTSNDKRCVLEARIKGRDPIAATGTGDSYDHALDTTIDKLKASLDTIIGKMQSY